MPAYRCSRSRPPVTQQPTMYQQEPMALAQQRLLAQQESFSNFRIWWREQTRHHTPPAHAPPHSNHHTCHHTPPDDTPPKRTPVWLHHIVSIGVTTLPLSARWAYRYQVSTAFATAGPIYCFANTLASLLEESAHSALKRQACQYVVVRRHIPATNLLLEAGLHPPAASPALRPSLSRVDVLRHRVFCYGDARAARAVLSQTRDNYSTLSPAPILAFSNILSASASTHW
jgi:hypothetical protein